MISENGAQAKTPDFAGLFPHEYAEIFSDMSTELNASCRTKSLVLLDGSLDAVHERDFLALVYGFFRKFRHDQSPHIGPNHKLISESNIDMGCCT